MTRNAFAELRARLDVGKLAVAEGLDGREDKRGRLHFTCPSCDRKHKAMSKDGAGWFCVACGAHGDAVDLVAHVRRLDAAEALRVARGLAGIPDDDREKWTPPPPRRAAPPPVVLSPDDATARTRALRLAALHYGFLGGWHRDEDTPWPGEHLAHLRDVAGLAALDAKRTERDAAAVHAYGARRLAALDGAVDPRLDGAVDPRLDGAVDPRLDGAVDPRLDGAVDPRLDGAVDHRLDDLVGAAPCPRSGLREHLVHLGVDLDAAVRTGLLRADGSEPLAGRLVYLWTDAYGVPVYLTGRAVPGLTREDAPKVLALPVHGTGADPAVGVPRPGVPFALAAALALPDPVFVVEGELQALAALAVGVAAVATGGTSRTRAEDLARCLAGRDLIVRFDTERDPAKQAATDARARDLARALGARWLPPEVRASLEAGVCA